MIHTISYIWDSEVHLGNLAFGVELSGCLIEIVVAMVGVATLPKEWTKRRKDHIRHQFEAFGVIASIIFLVALVSNHRIDTLRDERIEKQAKGIQQQIAQSSSKANALDPTNGPVRIIEAHVFFQLKKVPEDVKIRSNIYCAWLVLWNPISESWKTNRHFSPSLPGANTLVCIHLFAESFTANTNYFANFSLDFRPSSDPDFVEPFFSTNPNLPAIEVLNGLEAFNLSVFSFLPSNAEIVQGDVVVTINSSLRRKFPIPAQKVGIGVTSPLWIKLEPPR